MLNGRREGGVVAGCSRGTFGSLSVCTLRRSSKLDLNPVEGIGSLFSLLNSLSSLCALAFTEAEEQEFFFSPKEAVLLESSKDGSSVAVGSDVVEIGGTMEAADSTGEGTPTKRSESSGMLVGGECVVGIV